MVRGPYPGAPVSPRCGNSLNFPISARLPSSRSAAADIASMGASRPVQIVNWRAAWWTSMPRPLQVPAPRARAETSSCVMAGA